MGDLSPLWRAAPVGSAAFGELFPWLALPLGSASLGERSAGAPLELLPHSSGRLYLSWPGLGGLGCCPCYLPFFLERTCCPLIAFFFRYVRSSSPYESLLRQELVVVPPPTLLEGTGEFTCPSWVRSAPQLSPYG